jgi:hypothetical protein
MEVRSCLDDVAPVTCARLFTALAPSEVTIQPIGEAKNTNVGSVAPLSTKGEDVDVDTVDKHHH